MERLAEGHLHRRRGACRVQRRLSTGVEKEAKKKRLEEEAAKKEAEKEAKTEGKKKRKRAADPIPEELPERWLRTHDDAVKIGAGRSTERVLLIEGKWLAKMDVEEVKYQVVSYACAIARSSSS
mmetsp:Transcript_13208/g.41873  ORF Transcript_13208/g.41873 Transcript_13208/m.41873 type:complete len:124 (+) Transcript_13208:269-640(+)